MVEQATDELARDVGPQRPTGSEVAEDPGHVGHAGEHQPPVRDGLGQIERLPVDGEVDVAQHAQVEAGGRDHHVGIDPAPRSKHDAVFVERLDVIGDHGGLARGDASEQVPVGHERHPLAPRVVGGREVGLDVVALGQHVGHHLDQFVFDQLWLLQRQPDQRMRVEEDLAAHDLVHPLLG